MPKNLTKKKVSVTQTITKYISLNFFSLVFHLMLQSNWSMAAMASKIPSLMILPKERRLRPKSCHLLVQSRIPPNSNVDSVPKSSPSKGYWIDTWNATAIPKGTCVPSVARDSTILLIWNDIREPTQVNKFISSVSLLFEYLPNLSNCYPSPKIQKMI